jgi:hypothetical protein
MTNHYKYLMKTTLYPYLKGKPRGITQYLYIKLVEQRGITQYLYIKLVEQRGITQYLYIKLVSRGLI